MTESQVKPQGTAYEQAVSMLNAADHLPSLVIIDPEHLLTVSTRYMT